VRAYLLKEPSAPVPTRVWPVQFAVAASTDPHSTLAFLSSCVSSSIPLLRSPPERPPAAAVSTADHYRLKDAGLVLVGRRFWRSRDRSQKIDQPSLACETGDTDRRQFVVRLTAAHLRTQGHHYCNGVHHADYLAQFAYSPFPLRRFLRKPQNLLSADPDQTDLVCVLKRHWVARGLAKSYALSEYEMGSVDGYPNL
jgi:hypothetical protein